MDNGYIIDTPRYNSDTYLYDVPILLNNDIKKTISCYRILNNTSLVYEKEPGYFYISTDNKYLYVKSDTEVMDILKNIHFSLLNPIKTNKDILEINVDPVLKYTHIISLVLFDVNCINLALEDNVGSRLNQIRSANKYNKHDCLVKNVEKEKENYFNIETKKNTIYERLSYAFTPSSDDSNPETITNIIDIHTYNKFYVYGLTTLNMLLIIIIIIMIVSLSDVNTTHKRIERLR
jgi:hypothetical protein